MMLLVFDHIFQTECCFPLVLAFVTAVSSCCRHLLSPSLSVCLSKFVFAVVLFFQSRPHHNLISSRYDSEGRLTNVTYPTGMVTSLHREIERSINIDIESSSRDDDVTVITNLSSVEASYTVVQGRDTLSACRTCSEKRAAHEFLMVVKLPSASHDGG